MKAKNRKQKGTRSLVVLGMVLTRKGGRMTDKRTKRGKSKDLWKKDAEQ
jgi:hypothetical protein